MKLLLALLVLPYLVLIVATPRGGLYTGLIFTPSDGYFYLDQILHGQRGAWLAVDYNTFRNISPLPVYSLYLMLGHVSPGLNGPIGEALVFHVARLLLAAAFTWQLWAFLGDCFGKRASRQAAFLFVLFTSGFGVYEELLGVSPRGPQSYDLSDFDSSSFFSLLYAPHFAGTLILTCVYLRGLLGLARRPNLTALVQLTVSGAAMSTLHAERPFVLGVTTVCFSGWLAARGAMSRRRWALAAAGIVSSLPYPLALRAVYGTNFYLTNVMPQHVKIPGPEDLAYYGLGLGLPLVFALAGVPRVLRSPRHLSTTEALLWSAAAGGAALFLLPVDPVYHRGDGAHMVFAILGAHNLVRYLLPEIWRKRWFARIVARRPLGYSRRRLRLLSFNIALIVGSSSVMALVLDSPRAVLAEHQDVYLEAADQSAFAYLRQHARSADVVAASPESSEYIAAYADTHVLVGNYEWTPDLGAETARLTRFWSQPTPDIAYLRSRHVSWLYVGPRERALGGFDPRLVRAFKLADRVGDTSLYRVSD